MKPIIEVKNLSKKYRLGEIQPYYTLRDSLAGVFKNPFAAVKAQLNKDEFWALKDINFEVNQGEVVGIIGRNGAGKSTLLKILSQITPPTEGEVILRGRVGSLLEVGTGFSPELTGRENIYLNGAVLGMKKSEVKKKFDEIVAFSEVEKFLDTPLKHYSSGMYMRLAFAVAAHLEPEILIVDEVLAVGDAEFQKKCLGKMGEVAGEGRTVLFVSHNMGAIQQLCNKSMFLKNGKISGVDNTNLIIDMYTETSQEASGYFNNKTNRNSMIKSVELFNSDMKSCVNFKYGDEMIIVLNTSNRVSKNEFGVEMRLKNSNSSIIGYMSSWLNSGSSKQKFLPGHSISITIPELNLTEDNYALDFILRIPKVVHIENLWDAVRFKVVQSQPKGSPLPIKASDELGSIIINTAKFNLIKNA